MKMRESHSRCVNAGHYVLRLFDENERMDIAMRMLKKVQLEIPLFAHVLCGKNSPRTLKLLDSATPPHIVRHIYNK